jgi:transcription antitermination factor NusG
MSVKMDYDYYACQLRKDDQETVNRIRRVLVHTPFKLITVFQDRQRVRLGVKGGRLAWTRNDLLNGYCFLRCPTQLNVQPGLRAIARDLRGSIEILKVGKHFSKINDVDKLGLSDVHDQYADKEVSFNTTKFDENSMVKVLKGRYLGHVGFIVTGGNRYYRSRRIEKIDIDGMKIDMPRVYLQNA